MKDKIIEIGLVTIALFLLAFLVVGCEEEPKAIHVADNKSFILPARHDLICCDCGLVHRVDLSVPFFGKQITATYTRDEARTEEQRAESKSILTQYSTTAMNLQDEITDRTIVILKNHEARIAALEARNEFTIEAESKKYGMEIEIDGVAFENICETGELNEPIKNERIKSRYELNAGLKHEYLGEYDDDFDWRSNWDSVPYHSNVIDPNKPSCPHGTICYGLIWKLLTIDPNE